MKILKSILLLLLAASPLFAANDDTVRVTLDLKNSQNDLVKVTVFPPVFKEKSAVYVIPAIIPGTYERQDFIRFARDFKAIDGKGKLLKIEREADGQIRIPQAQMLARLEYYMGDSFDDSVAKNYVFPPAGTNIQRDTNFLLNHSGMFGYFEGKKDLPYSISVIKPRGFYGATSLDVREINDTLDVLKAANYVHVVDNPAMYSRPDTVSYMEGRTRIGIAVYSPDPKVNAARLERLIRPLTGAIQSFLGTMPVDRYNFIFYFLGNNRAGVSRVNAWGALEHSYSSVYFLPTSIDTSRYGEFIGSTVVHEFLHILVPLNLHTEEIADFNYRTPKMSRHLWLYEGVTEYFSHLAQVQGGIIDEDAFLKEIRGKAYNTETLKRRMSLITLSEKVLEPVYEDYYGIVYEKGAVTALLLDIRLRELSQGDMTLLKLINILSAQHGPDKPFKDAELIDTIVSITYPEIGDFFKEYVIGDSVLPYEEFLSKIGWNFLKDKKTMELSHGELRVGIKAEGEQPRIRFESGENTFGVEKGDTLLTINGKAVTEYGSNTWETLDTYLFKPKESVETTIQIKRGSEILTLRSTPSLIEWSTPYVIEKVENPTRNQMLLKESLLYRKPFKPSVKSH